jgi:hypothetical protein
VRHLLARVISYVFPSLRCGAVSRVDGSRPARLQRFNDLCSSCFPPSITAEPANHTVTVGQTASFTVAATGTAPLLYQCQRNGAALSGATSPSYTTPATTSSDNGTQFTVVVSNSACSVTSSAATPTVNVAAPAVNLSRTSLTFGSQAGGHQQCRAIHNAH